MSTESTRTTQTMKAGADLRTAQFKVLKIDTAANDQLILATAATSGLNIAICGNKPNTGEAVEAIMDGFCKAVAGAAIASSGLELSADATGRVITGVSAAFIIGYSRMAAGAAGDVIEIHKLSGGYLKA